MWEGNKKCRYLRISTYIYKFLNLNIYEFKTNIYSYVNIYEINGNNRSKPTIDTQKLKINIPSIPQRKLSTTREETRRTEDYKTTRNQLTKQQ